jgi:hypothetical protein
MSSQEETVIKQQKRPRCEQCSAKVGHQGFKCKCGGVYCSTHRYSDTHGCTYDHVAEERRRLQVLNPVVSSSKIPIM